MRISYISDDGLEFATQEACEAHERNQMLLQFVPGYAAMEKFSKAVTAPWTFFSKLGK